MIYFSLDEGDPERRFNRRLSAFRQVEFQQVLEMISSWRRPTPDQFQLLGVSRIPVSA
jgi:hypothetical protein